MIGAFSRLGLTGGIGSGKSTVASCLVKCGATLIDTDAIARAITAPAGLAMPAVMAEFGGDIVDASGALDRARMRQRVFADTSARHRLESILHPLIGSEALRQASLANTEVVVFDVPLLSESSPWRARCERIVVVDCSEEVQLQRVTARSGWSEAQVRSVIAQQSSRARRRAIADAVIDNEALTLVALAREVSQLWALWYRCSAVV